MRAFFSVKTNKIFFAKVRHIFCKSEMKGTCIVLKQVSVFLETASRVHKIMWKELPLQVTQSRCRSTETNLNLTNS